MENKLQMTTDQQVQTEACSPLLPGHHADPLLAARGARYGAFVENASISQSLKMQMRACPKWPALDADMKEALEMVAHKISRPRPKQAAPRERARTREEVEAMGFVLTVTMPEAPM